VLALSPRVPAHWPAFEITLRLDGGQVLTLRWQREGAAASALPAPHRVLAEGETVRLSELPAQAVLLVQR
jgi:cyclic beta-1,2-glucan synthetase